MARRQWNSLTRSLSYRGANRRAAALSFREALLYSYIHYTKSACTFLMHVQGRIRLRAIALIVDYIPRPVK